MAGLRERKKLMTRAAIHDAAMRLFAEHGYNGTTIADIADAADVSRATFFSYFASKDDVVFGDAPQAAQALAAMLAELPEGTTTLDAVRNWLRTLTGWLGDERLPLQQRLAIENPSVAARRHQIHAEFEDIIAAALAREIASPERELVARMVAASAVGALTTAETAAAERTAASGRALSSTEVEQLLDATMAFIDGGLDRVNATDRASSPPGSPPRP